MPINYRKITTKPWQICTANTSGKYFLHPWINPQNSANHGAGQHNNSLKMRWISAFQQESQPTVNNSIVLFIYIWQLNHSSFPIELSASALSSALVAVNCLMYCQSLCRNTIHVQCQAEPLRQETAGQERPSAKTYERIPVALFIVL